MRNYGFSVLLITVLSAAVTASAVFSVPQDIHATEPEGNTGTIYVETEAGTETRIDADLPEGQDYVLSTAESGVSLSGLEYDEEAGTYYFTAFAAEETGEEITISVMSGEEEVLRVILLPSRKEPEEALPSETALNEYVANEEQYAESSPVSVNILYGTAWADGNIVTEAQTGTVLRLEADEDTEDKVFLRWSDGETDRVREYTLTGALTLEAVFAEKHRITVKDAEATETSAFAGDRIVVTAPEKNGYRFESWQYDGDLEYTEEGAEFSFIMPDRDVSVTAVYAALGGRWVKTKGGWVYAYEDGSRQDAGWALIKGKYYLFDENGYMLSGWQKVKNKWYYLKDSGAMAVGWQKIDGRWYYLNPNGVMAVGWVKVAGSWYYMGASGAMLTGWREINGKWYFLKSSGAMHTGWYKEGDKWYYLDSSGAMTTGWQKIKGKWYLMGRSGAMLTGWQKDNGRWYYLNKAGDMVTGWRKSSSKWYYLNSSGAMTTGWQKIKGKWYLMSGSGAMLTGWQKDNGKWYYLNKAGDMFTGWKRIKGEYYFLSESGAMLTGTQVVDGKTYQFKTNGALKTGSFSDLKILFVDTEIKPNWSNLYKLFGKTGAKTYFLNTADFNVDDYDALVLGGGFDVDPALYGESNQGSRNVDTAEDKLQLAAIKKFVEAGKPVFGVCRGEQVINVYFGGTLHQDKSGHMGVYRAVTVAEGSLFEGTVSDGYSAYHSHHQAVKKLGSGLWATSYDVKDGLIEGFEHKSLPVFGVQYHPEAMGNCDAILTTFLKVVHAHKLGITKVN